MTWDVDRPWIEVAVALVQRNGRWLVGRRVPEAHLGGLWEFPGGKCEPGEAPEAAAVRELLEEGAVEARAMRVSPPFDLNYTDRRVRLTAVHCQWIRGEGEPHGCQELRWVTLGELRRLEMPEGNLSIIRELEQHATG